MRNGAQRAECRGRKWSLWGLGALVLGVVALWAQDRTPQLEEQPRKEGKFTWARIYFDVPMRHYGPIGAANGPPWSHDWPRGEEHFMKIMAEVTKLDVNPGGHLISFMSDECFKYPAAYLCEPGYMNLSEEEARRMSEYLLRGGFIMADDFRGERELDNLRREMKKVFPDRNIEEIPRTHPIWNSFYDIRNVYPPASYDMWRIPQYLGISDDKGRLMMVINYNQDMSEYWEWSDNPFMPIDETNEAYKYGVDYLMYTLTH